MITDCQVGAVGPPCAADRVPLHDTRMLQAIAMPRAGLRRNFSPLFLQSLGGYRQRCTQLLGEERDAKFLEHPAELFQLHVVQAALVM